MNSTQNASNNVLKLVQDSVQQPSSDIFEDLGLQMTSGDQQAPVKEAPAPDTTSENSSPDDEMIYDDDTDSKLEIDFSLSSFKEEGTDDEIEEVSLDALSPNAKGKFQQSLHELKDLFLQSLDEQFKKSLIPPPKKRSVFSTKEVSEQNLDHLSLVSNEELDLQILLSHVEASLLESNQDPLTLLCMRFEHVIKHEIQATRLPIGPIAIGHAFQHAVTSLDIDLNEKKIILSALLASLKSRYRAILDKANQIFIQNNILPKLTEEDSRVRRKKDETKALAKEKRQKLLGISEDNEDTMAVSAEIARFIEQVKIPEGAEQHFVKGNSNAPIISTKELASKIDLLKTQPKKEADNDVYFSPDDSEISLAEQLKIEASLDDVGLDKKESNTIGIMSMLFEDLLDNENIPGPIKALLQQLRAPLLKAAVQDEMFFGDTENPAQKFFNEIAQASLSWSPSKNPETDTLYKKMSALVSKVNTGFEDDYLIFDDAIEDLDLFNESESKRTEKIEGRLVQTEEAQVRHQSAKEVSNTHIDDKFSHAKLPPDIHNFFNTTWRQVLFFIFNKTHSINSEEWLDAIEVEDSLLANLSDSDEDDIDIFLDILEETLTEAGIQEFETKKQLSAIKKVMLEENSVTIDMVEQIKSTKTNVTKIFQDPASKVEDEDTKKIIEQLHIGTWLQKNTEEPPVKVKIAAHIKFNDSYVMVLRSGAKEGTYKCADLIKMIENNEMTIQENTLVFDSALESVIEGIIE